MTASPHPAWLLEDENGRPVSTFFPTVAKMIRIKTAGEVEEHVQVSLRFKGGKSTEVQVPLLGLDCVDWFALDRRCILAPNPRTSGYYIANIIRMGVANAPVEERQRLNRLGIHCLGDEVLFVAGDRLITRSDRSTTVQNLEVQDLGFRLDIDPNLGPKEAFDGMRELISLSDEIGRVLIAHTVAGITRAAFKEAGITPCAVLVILGQSGILKSHYVPHLVQLYNRGDEIRAVTRFNSTNRFIEDVLDEYAECTAVLDDLHTAEARSIKRTNEATAEEIIRRIADDTGRGRKEGKALIQKKFRGNAVFIGEYTIGKESTIPRALVAELTRAPDGRVLDKFQRHQPLLVSTFYFFFLRWYVGHFHEICGVIDRDLTEFRGQTANSGTHGRLKDTYFYLQAAYKIFLEFCTDSGFCEEQDALDEYDEFAKILLGLIRAQQARFKPEKRDCEQDYLGAIRYLYQQKRFRLADSKEQFQKKEYDGLFYYRCLCLRGKCLERELEKIFPDFNLKNAITALQKKDALKLVSSKNTIQISGLNGVRFYAIRMKHLQD